ncbi:MAG: hypothetical protein ABIT76_10210 [Chthoniobacterales bacterium]
MSQVTSIVQPSAEGSGNLMLAISSRSPNSRNLLERSAGLAEHFHCTFVVVHVRQQLTLHYRTAATRHPVPEADLAHARKLGATVIVENGDVLQALVRISKAMNIRYFVTGRSLRSRLSLTWKLPLAEQLQRKVADSVVIII